MSGLATMVLADLQRPLSLGESDCAAEHRQSEQHRARGNPYVMSAEAAAAAAATKFLAILPTWPKRTQNSQQTRRLQ